MNRRQLLGSAAATLVLASRAAGAVRARRKPNFIVVLCDDLGFGDVGFNGGSIPTPNIDRLAREGLRLENYYAPANLCTPSRAGFLTGRYPVRTGLGWAVIGPNDDRGLPLGEQTIANALEGYASALVGKWHLGHVAPYWPPTKHGFDLFYGIPYSHDMDPLALYEARATSTEVKSQPVDLPVLQQQFYAAAERFIDENRTRPFFLELALSAPHLPNKSPPPFDGASPLGPYADTVMEIDSIIGRLLAKLKSAGIDEDTLVVLTSDNGAWFEGSSGPLRDRKGGAAYDGAARVPCVVRQPGVIPANRRAEAITCGIDWLPTFCALSGSGNPPGVELDGRDISAVLTQGAASPHEEILLFDDENVVGLRTQRFKYVQSGYWRGGLMNFQDKGYDELYDLTLDPGENYSVSERHPDVVAQMRARLEQAQQRFAPFRHAGRPPYGTGLRPRHDQRID
ncbi:sulfatase-like hydrolase/transferase [Sphingomonas sp. ac-8]|uniref:sulfatase-like hydrolase/transferase n=1 Tax=Sphingomonas sp. ac-8 TaxID=3242977 RepID=UPI003A80548F